MGWRCRRHRPHLLLISPRNYDCIPLSRIAIVGLASLVDIVILVLIDNPTIRRNTDTDHRIFDIVELYYCWLAFVVGTVRLHNLPQLVQRVCVVALTL